MFTVINIAVSNSNKTPLISVLSPEPEEISVSMYDSIPEMIDIIEYKKNLGYSLKTIGFTREGYRIIIMEKY